MHLFITSFHNTVTVPSTASAFTFSHPNNTTHNITQTFSRDPFNNTHTMLRYAMHPPILQSLSIVFSSLLFYSIFFSYYYSLHSFKFSTAQHSTAQYNTAHLSMFHVKLSDFRSLTHRQTDKQTDRQIDTHTHTHSHKLNMKCEHDNFN